MQRIDNIWTFIQSSPSNDPKLPLPKVDLSEDKPKREDYPSVRFWCRNEWESFVTEAKASSTWHQNTSKTGPCDSLAFITDPNGKSINRIQATAIRQFARGLWQTLANANRDPITWGSADLSVIRFYRNNMYSDFPDLRLCDNDWKVDMIAQKDYPSWHRSHGSNFPTKPSIKRSTSEYPEETDETMIPTKKIRTGVMPPEPGPVSATNTMTDSNIPTLSSCTRSTTTCATTQLDPALSATNTSIIASKSKGKGKKAIIYWENHSLNHRYRVSSS